jgi:2-polyprenyl-3-methyl-5-hydroxy-6-metoxy-1,4-benzoquinol methylase
MKENKQLEQKRWYEISSDPNDMVVLRIRQQALNEARVDHLLPDRLQYFCELVQGKDILDVGVVAHTQNAVNSTEWLHRHLSRAARSCLGVDILEQEVAYLKSLGFNVLCEDITQNSLNQKFDVIVCGEILEHLNSPGNLLANVSSMLRPNGRVVISVPNPWYINVMIKSALNGLPYVDNADHVCWFDPCTLCELGERHGLRLDRFIGVAVYTGKGLPAKLLFKLRPALITLGLRPEIFAKTLIYEFILGS